MKSLKGDLVRDYLSTMMQNGFAERLYKLKYQVRNWVKEQFEKI